MYTNHKYEQQGGNDIGLSSLSWRAQQSRDLNGYSQSNNRQQYISPAATDIPSSEISRPKSLLDQTFNGSEGSRLSWRASNSVPSDISLSETSRPKSLLDSRDWGQTNNRDQYPVTENRLKDNSPGNLHWRANELGQPARTDRYPTKSSDERYNDPDPSLLSWRGSQSGSQCGDIRSPSLGYTQKPLSLSSATHNPPVDNIPPRPLLGSNDIQPPETSRPKSLIDEYYNGGVKSSTLSWRASQPVPGATRNSQLENTTPRSLLDDRLPSDVPRPKPLIDDRYDNPGTAQLSWRAAQSESRNAIPPDIRQPPIDAGRCFEDVNAAARPDPYLTKPGERFNGTEATAELSWRKTSSSADNVLPLASSRSTLPELGRRCEDTRPGISDRYPASTVKSDIQPVDNSRPKSLLDNTEPMQLSWRAAQSILNSLPPSDSLRSTNAPAGRYEDMKAENIVDREHDGRPSDAVNAERLSWRAANTGSNNIDPPKPLLSAEGLDRRYSGNTMADGLSWRAANAGSNNIDPPKPLLSTDGPADRRYNDANTGGLSWRAKEMGSIDRPTPLMPAEGPDRRYNEVNTAGLSWRAKEMGAKNIEPAKPLLPAEGPDRRYNDVNTAGLSWRSKETDVRPNDIGASGLSWRSANPAAPTGLNAPKSLMQNEVLDNSRPLSWREAGTGGSLLGKTRYSDMYPESNITALRDAVSNLTRAAGYPSKAYY